MTPDQIVGVALIALSLVGVGVWIEQARHGGAK